MIIKCTVLINNTYSSFGFFSSLFFNSTCLQKHMPMSFCTIFGTRVAVIVDCFEILFLPSFKSHGTCSNMVIIIHNLYLCQKLIYIWFLTWRFLSLSLISETGVLTVYIKRYNNRRFCWSIYTLRMILFRKLHKFLYVGLNIVY